MAEKRALTGRIVLKTIHIVAVCGWLGGGFAIMAVLGLAGSLTAGSGDDSLHQAIRTIDTWIIVPSAGLASATGVLLCATSAWGFVRYRWIIAKWAVTFTLIVFGTGWLAPWLERLAGLAAAGYHPFWYRVTVAASLQTLALLLLVVLSILKPGKPADNPLHHATHLNVRTIAGWPLLLFRRVCRP